MLRCMIYTCNIANMGAWEYRQDENSFLELKLTLFSEQEFLR